MRGKVERARSGKLPQATGKGIYGYRYDKETGKREVVGDQAEVGDQMGDSGDCHREEFGEDGPREVERPAQSPAQHQMGPEFASPEAGLVATTFWANQTLAKASSIDTS